MITSSSWTWRGLLSSSFFDLFRLLASRALNFLSAIFLSDSILRISRRFSIPFLSEFDLMSSMCLAVSASALTALSRASACFLSWADLSRLLRECLDLLVQLADRLF